MGQQAAGGKLPDTQSLQDFFPSHLYLLLLIFSPLSFPPRQKCLRSLGVIIIIFLFIKSGTHIHHFLNTTPNFCGSANSKLQAITRYVKTLWTRAPSNVRRLGKSRCLARDGAGLCPPHPRSQGSPHGCHPLRTFLHSAKDYFHGSDEGRVSEKTE